MTNGWSTPTTQQRMTQPCWVWITAELALPVGLVSTSTGGADADADAAADRRWGTKGGGGGSAMGDRMFCAFRARSV